MRRIKNDFYVQGTTVDADLWLPEVEPPTAALIACSGYQGLKVIHPERFARALLPRGYAVLAFDYRGFGDSGGRRGRIVPQEQVEDVRGAVAALAQAPAIGNARIGLIGWALGGGVAIQAAADDARVHAVAVLNAIGDGERSLRAMHDEQSWSELCQRIEADRRARATGSEPERIDPFKVVRLRGTTRDYVDEQLYREDGFGSQVTLECAEASMRFHPELYAHRVSPRPLLIVHGTANDLHPVEEARSLYEHAREPKRLELLDDQGHTEWMFDDHPTFQRVVTMLDDFFGSALSSPKQMV